MLRSMTGFGRGENNDGIRNFTVEMKSINHRYNDIIVKVPKHISYLEEKIKKEVKKHITRGRVEIYIGLEYVKDIEMEVKVNIPLVQSYKNALEKIGTELNIDSNLNIDLITKFPDILKTERKEEDEDEIWNSLKEGIRIALEELIAMREEEGKLLSNDIKEKTDKIESLINDIEERAPKVVLEYKEKLENRINELLENKYDIDESKLANEVAYFADKTGIDEEIVRFNSHIIQLRKSLESKDSIGRKLDFMLQEMNREVNTIGSKVGDIEITNKVVDIKTELEKIREQIQNIE